jgi:hypothetical protein
MVDDAIIHFQCAILNHVNKRNYFVAPCVVCLIQEFPPLQIIDQITPLKLQQYRNVFLPLSTKDRENKHWSLLVWHPGAASNQPMWCHFDTCLEFNHESARRLAVSIWKLFKIQSKSFHKMRAPRQTNAYDCGIYIMAMMAHFAVGTPGGTMLEILTEDYIRNFRREFANDIRTNYVLKDPPGPAHSG